MAARLQEQARLCRRQVRHGRRQYPRIIHREHLKIRPPRVGSRPLMVEGGFLLMNP